MSTLRAGTTSDLIDTFISRKGPTRPCRFMMVRDTIFGIQIQFEKLGVCFTFKVFENIRSFVHAISIGRWVQFESSTLANVPFNTQCWSKILFLHSLNGEGFSGWR